MIMRCRKNQSTLTSEEKARFVNAVLALKADGTYDQFVADHMSNMSNAHRGPAFLPWHRQFLDRFELELQRIDSRVTLPYWDWSIDNSPLSSIWGDDFMGGDGRASDGRVMSGPFAYDAGNFPLLYDGPDLRRRFGASIIATTLPTPADMANALAETVYDVAPYGSGSTLAGFRNTLEGWRNGPQLHNRVHVWVGASMGLDSSPNDPVFFLHHCFVDKLWADWQALHPAAGYVPVSGASPGHNLNDDMEPWASRGESVSPAGTLDHHAMGYAYDTEGVCRLKLKILDDPVTTIKVLDDPVTVKFLDDGGTLKTIDDGGPTLKVLDDGGTLKTIDDVPTLKFRDDGGTLKTIDDGTLKTIDDGGPKLIEDGTNKNIDDVKSPALDTGPMIRQAPFVLSTPHHTMAWARTFPGSLEAAIQHLEVQIQHHVTAAQQLRQQAGQGKLDAASQRQLEILEQEIEALMRDRDSLVGQVNP